MQEKDWKKFLLKSGLPFEYEIKECLVKHGCTVWDEYSYLRKDELESIKEFSYDLDAYYLKSGSYVNFLIECKYKTEPTRWFFTPDPYAYQDEINQNSFFHPIDYFITEKFLFNQAPFSWTVEPLGPICLKGTEIYKGSSISINIEKAISQLSYAFIFKVLNAIESQLEDHLFHSTTFFNIPIIITNAELYLINEKLTTKEIEAAKGIEEVSQKHNFLIHHVKANKSLSKYNEEKLKQFFSERPESIFELRNKSFAKDLEQFIEIVAFNYSPQSILIMHHDHAHENFKQLFNYIETIVSPTPDFKQKAMTVNAEWHKRLQMLNTPKIKGL